MKIALIVLLILGGVLVTGALFVGPQLLDTLAALKPETPATLVRTESAASGALTETVAAPGDIEPHTQVEIAAEVSARIEELPVKEGQNVRKGDLLAKLVDRDVRAALLSARARRDAEKFRLESERARLEGLRSNLEFAQRELGRMSSLFQSGDVSQRDLDNAREHVNDLKTTIDTATFSISVVESSLAAAEADIEQAETAIDNTVILSPMDGRITALNVELGEVVTGSTTNPGTVLMAIADLSRMVHIAEVAESDIARVQIGQRARLYINAYTDRVFSGTVREIAWQRTTQPDGTGFFKTEIEIDLQGEQIRSGHKANTEIEIATHQGILVPYQAILARDIESLPAEMKSSPLLDTDPRTRSRKASVVYRVIDGKAAVTPVKAGASDATHRVVLDGLTEGDMIIVGPFKVLESIKHDDKVKREGEPATKSEDADDDSDAPDIDSTEAPPDSTTGAWNNSGEADGFAELAVGNREPGIGNRLEEWQFGAGNRQSIAACRLPIALSSRLPIPGSPIPRGA